MKIYVAGSFVDREAIREQASRLWPLGHEVTSTWLHEVAKHETMSQDEFMRKIAIKDIAEVMMADLIILDNKQSTGGKNCEWGLGLGSYQKKQLWLIGDPSNVFHYLADRFFDSWDEVIANMVQGKDVTNHAI
jgi:hypothetical protein